MRARCAAALILFPQAVDPGDTLKELGGAGVLVATAASGASMSPLFKGTRQGGRFIAVGASFEPLAITTMDLIFGGFTVEGSLTGRSIENEDNLRFAARNGVRPMVENVPLADAASGYARMLSNEARFRVVLSV